MKSNSGKRHVTYIFQSPFRGLGLILIFMFITGTGFSQEAYMNLADTTAKGLFKNFVGIKLFVADFAATSANKDLQLYYVSNNVGDVYTFQHDMNVTGLKNFYNLGIGTEENLGKHLSINFNTSLGYMQNMWDWNIGGGAGYFVSLNKSHSLRLNACLNFYFETITYSFGTHYDTNGLGFIVNGENIGISIKNLKYVNSIWSLSPGIELLYRRPSFDYFVGVYYNYVFTYHEKVNFYQTSVPVSQAIYYQNTNSSAPLVPVSGNITNLGKYIIQVGIIREFGL